MQFIDLAKQQSHIRGAIDARIKAVLDHGNYIMGPEVRELEALFCSFTGAKHCITCSSGTDALLMPLMAWGIKQGDAVFVPPFTFFATAEEPALLGATPIFVDVDPVTFNMRPDLLEKAIEAVQKGDPSIYPLPRAACERKLTPRAVIPVDLFGQAADYQAILAIAKAHGLKVIEDAAQSFGGSRHGKMNCALGCHAAATSFFPAKPLGCYGDGGAVFTDDDELAELLKSIRVHGKGEDKYDNVRLGLNGRIDTLQAAILLAKMEIFPQEIESRQQVAAWYAQHLAGIDGEGDIVQALDAQLIVHGEVLYLQTGGNIHRVGTVDIQGDAVAHHHIGEGLLVGILGHHIADVLALAQHRHAVGHREHLMQLVGDDDDGLAVRFHVAHHAKELLRFLRRKNGGWFI